MMQAFCPSTASAISSPCKSRKFPPLCMSTPPADMAGAFVTVSPTNANGPGNWKMAERRTHLSGEIADREKTYLQTIINSYKP